MTSFSLYTGYNFLFAQLKKLVLTNVIFPLHVNNRYIFMYSLIKDTFFTSDNECSHTLLQYQKIILSTCLECCTPAKIPSMDCEP